MKMVDILIVGGGAAGISAAKGAFEAGCRNILLADRLEALGGILRQCVHYGFGPGLNGPEYTQTISADFPDSVVLWQNATVTRIRKNRTARILGPEIGDRTVSFQQLILAAGCREIPIGALPIAGTRPSGIYTAGQMQEMMNLHGFLPQGDVVILGSGDLGLIMASQIAQLDHRVTLVEQQPSCGGLARNRRCLELPNVRLHCGVTIEEVFGHDHIEQVLLTDGTILPCGTLLTAVGLMPERSLLRDLGEPDWLHLCGNCRKVHPMAETVTAEGFRAGHAAWERLRGTF